MKKILIFLDDIRYPKDIYSHEKLASFSRILIFRSVRELQEFIINNGVENSHLSLDHDLGENVPDGSEFAKWLISYDESHNILKDNITVHIHSANWEAKKKMLKIEAYINFKHQHNKHSLDRI